MEIPFLAWLIAMTMKRRFTKAEITVAAKVAKEQGVTVRLDADGALTISPASVASSEEEELDRELEAFSRKHEPRPNRIDQLLAGKADRESTPHLQSKQIHVGGYIWEPEEFEQYIKDKPLNKREKTVLEVLSKFGVGVEADFHQVKVGCETEDRLKARGYIETRPQKKFPDRTGAYVLTEAGLSAYKIARERQ